MSSSSTILLVDDNPSMIHLMGRLLSGLGQLRFATSGPAALQQMRESPPDLVLLDAEMPGMNGYEVCEAMQADPAVAGTPVIFVTAHSDPEFELKGLEIGAVDFIAKPISEPLLVARVRTQLRLKRLTDELRSIATLDSLTGLANRRHFDAALEREWRRCQREAAPLALLLIDVDHFKRYNDRYGHPAGDDCLGAVTRTLTEVLQRPADLAARYGGEEFALLLPHTHRAGAEHVAHRVLDAIENLALPHAASPTSMHVTVSVGVACASPDGAAAETTFDGASAADAAGGARLRNAAALLRAADMALYAAKAAGRAQAWVLDLDDPDDAGAEPVEIDASSRPARLRDAA